MLPYAYSSIKIKSFLFPLDVDWSADSSQNVTLVDFGICFGENDDLFEPKIDIKEDEIVRTRMSHHPLFLVPLYATTYDLQAMILVGVEGQSDIYHRLGGIEIPIRIEEGVQNKNPMHFNWEALHLLQHIERHKKGVETSSRFSTFEIL